MIVYTVELTGSEVPLLSFAAKFLPYSSVSSSSSGSGVIYAGTRLEDIDPEHQARLVVIRHCALRARVTACRYAVRGCAVAVLEAVRERQARGQSWSRHVGTNDDGLRLCGCVNGALFAGQSAKERLIEGFPAGMVPVPCGYRGC
jgi:hypothetical protein